MVFTKYPDLNSTDISGNLANIFVYANDVTNGMAVLFIIIAFFVITLVSSILMAMRITGRFRFESHLAASSFVTFGFCVILSQVSGLLNPWWLLAPLALTALSVAWLLLSSD